ncbi:MAG: TlpA disulfide reductase family protein [Mucilaginibacter sp.]|uniref:TlpA family protein disulfide reductase n=1 Tax=Mucilaginibacter sp. TaxID=1882438 RepID=UPI003262F140
MKKRLFYLLSIALTMICAHASAQVTVSGKIIRYAGRSITCHNRDRYLLQIPVDKIGNFKATISVDSGYYFFDQHLFYLEPGFNLIVDLQDSIYSFKGRGSVENTLLTKINNTLLSSLPFENGNPQKIFFLEPTEFYNSLADYQSKVSQLLSTQNISKFFFRTQKLKVEYTIKYIENEYLAHYGIDLDRRRQEIEALNNTKSSQTREERLNSLINANNAMRTKRLTSQQKNELNAKIWENFDINIEILYRFSSEYIKLVDSRLSILQKAQFTKEPYLRSKNLNEVKRDIVKSEIFNNYIREKLFYYYTSILLKTGKNYDQYYNDYLSLAKDTANIAEIKQLYQSEKLLSPGSPSPKFELNDPSGKKVALDSFKGKFVYIDLWATWCGPCIEEIPALKEIQNKYQNKNICFVSISIDNPGDTLKWKTFITSHSLGGTQLIVENAWNSDFIKKYGVATIPRFILIDTNGNIVSANAERPSVTSLQNTLDKLLL